MKKILESIGGRVFLLEKVGLKVLYPTRYPTFDPTKVTFAL